MKRVLGDKCSNPITIYPEIRMKNLPFFEVVHTLMQPSPLLTVEMVKNRALNNFQLLLEPQQATDIGLNRGRPVNRYQVHLRFCQPQKCSVQDDKLPHRLQIIVNGDLLLLPPFIPPKKHGEPPKLPPVPIDITPSLKLSPTVNNFIQILHEVYANVQCVVSVYLVKQLTCNDLLKQLQSKEVQSVEVTRTLIKEKMSVDTDCDLRTTMLKVSLVCPLSRKRITVPCRLSTCSHIQCFDAETYLQMNENRESWSCPFCRKPAFFGNLIIDGYFQEILTSSEHNEIEFNPDGFWTKCE